MRISDWSSDVCSSDLTILAIYPQLYVRTVGDMGELPSTIPSFFIPNVPFTFETLQIIFPFSLTMAAVGLLESMMPAQIVDDLIDSPINRPSGVTGKSMSVGVDLCGRRRLTKKK